MAAIQEIRNALTHLFRGGVPVDGSSSSRPIQDVPQPPVHAEPLNIGERRLEADLIEKVDKASLKPTPQARLTELADDIAAPMVKTALMEAVDILNRPASVGTIDALHAKLIEIQEMHEPDASAAYTLLSREYARFVWQNYQIFGGDAALFQTYLHDADITMEQFSSIQLSEKEIAELQLKPVEWIMSEWDIIENLDRSPSSAQQLMGRLDYAVATLIKLKGIQNEETKRALDYYNSRRGLYLMKHVLLNKDLDNARHVATELGMRGLFVSYEMVNGGVGIAANRFSEVLERQRILRGNTIEPPSVEEAKRIVHDELFREATARVYGDKFGTNADEIEKNVKRSVLIGYNWFIASEQLAVHVARGDLQGGGQQIINEPFTYLASLFRVLEFSIEKYSFLSTAQMAFVKRAIERLGKGDKLTGIRKFDQIVQVNDLLSSTWRINPIVETMNLRYGDEAKYFGLGFRIRGLGAGKNTEDRLKDKETGHDKCKLEEVWERVAEVRPLKIAKLYKDRAMTVRKLEMDQEYEEKYVKTGKEKTQEAKDYKELIDNRTYSTAEDESFSVFLENNRAIFGTFHTYAEVEIEISKYLNPLYVHMNETKKHIDFQHLNLDQRNIITNLGGDPVRVGEMVRRLSQFGKDQMEDLLSRDEFYTRTLFYDDVLFAEVEKEGEIPKNHYGTMSNYFTIGGGEEPYPRIFNDTYAASQFVEHLLEFVKGYKMEALAQMANTMTNYQSPEVAAEVIEALAEAYVTMAKSDSFLAWTGLDRLPINSSEMQRLFGQGQVSLDPEEMRAEINKINLILGKFIPGIQEQLEHAAGSSSIELVIYKSRWELVLILMILAKEGLEQAEGQGLH